MDASAAIFRRNLADLEKFLEHARKNIEERAPAKQDGSKKRPASEHNARRRFYYASGIVSLYGFFEQFVKSHIVEYLEHLQNTAVHFSDLPETIRRNHTKKSVEAIERSTRSTKREQTSQEELISNLHSCITNSDSYRLNTVAFAYTELNMRADTLKQLWSALNVHGLLSRMIETRAYAEYLTAIGADDGRMETPKALESYLSQQLSDLVDRRNDAAHGNLDDILSIDLVQEKARFIHMIVDALTEVARHSWGEVAVKAGSCNEMGPIMNVFNHVIVCVCNLGKRVSVGDLLISSRGNPPHKWFASQIEEIQIDKVSQNVIEAGDPVNIGMKGSHRIKRKDKIFVLNRPHT